MIDDSTLLRRYAAQHAEDAFAEIVRRHLPLVYSAAVRRLGGDTHRAKDVAQAVFCTVARDAQHLANHAALTAWLYAATRNAVVDEIRSDRSRRGREIEAGTMQEILADGETTTNWSRLRPVIDAVMDELGDEEREAVLLRFFEDRRFAEIGAVLGLSEDAARKRVDRALDKLRELLERRKIASTAAALGVLLSSEAIAAPPAGLAAAINGAAMATGGAAMGTTAFLTATKLKLGVAALVIAGGAAGLVTQQRAITAVREQASVAEQHVAALVAENRRLSAEQTTATAERSQLLADLAALKRAVPTPPRGPTIATPVAADKAGTPAAGAAATAPALRAPSNPARLAQYQRNLAEFVRQRGLTSEQADKLYAILSDWDEVSTDFQAAIRTKGLVWTPEAQTLRNRLQQQIEVGPLTALLGHEGQRAYFDFEASSFYRALVEPVTQRLAREKLPVTEEERARLVALAKANMRRIKPDPTSMGSEVVVEWESVIATAAGFLRPEQIAVMRTEVARLKSPR